MIVPQIMSKKEISLVTGASGFVGRAVCERALSLGLKVRGTCRSASSQSLIPVGVESVKVASIGQETDWSHALDGVDVVVHLAARVHRTKESLDDSLAAYREVNTIGTSRLARLAATAGVKRFVYVSTVKVNGQQSAGVPFTEEDTPQPQDVYAISKWESEQALKTIGEDSGLEVVILRPPLVYGSNVGANFMRLLGWVRRGIPLPLASVSNRRSLIYVKNLADAILAAATHAMARGQTFFVRDNDDVSTPELIRRIAFCMGRLPRMFWCPPRLLAALGTVMGKSAELDRLLGSLAVNSSKISRELGWAPPYTMSQGLKDTVDWYLTTCS